jgi:prepilin-type N-terminal cleavage/methylation domain-containing protein
MKRLEKGFTLIELMIVVAIIAILAAVAVPKFGGQIKKSKDAKGLAVIGALRSSSSVYYADNDGIAATDVHTVLKATMDDASQKLISNPSTGVATGGAMIVVGTNDDTSGNSVYTSGTSILVALDEPNTIDGTIDIASSNGEDEKGKDWQDY